MDKNLKSEQINTGIKNDLKETSWVDVLQLEVKWKKCIKGNNGLVQSLGLI